MTGLQIAKCGFGTIALKLVAMVVALIAAAGMAVFIGILGSQLIESTINDQYKIYFTPSYLKGPRLDVIGAVMIPVFMAMHRAAQTQMRQGLSRALWELFPASYRLRCKY